MGKYALLIGVSEYPEGLTPLPAATQDVAAMERILREPTLGGFDDVQALINPRRHEMDQSIERWFRERQPEDLALLFFSGHGVKDERRELYFAASDTEKHREQLMRSTAVSAQTIHNYICDSRCKHQVVILDCCFSGAFGNVLVKDSGEVPLEETFQAAGRVVLTSTNSIGYSFEEKDQGLSIYSRYLVEGIEKGAADLNGDGWITVDELHEFARRKVQEESPAMSPKIITLKDEGYKLPIARSPQDKPEVKYRKEVEKKARRGQFTIPARHQLNSLRTQYGLSKEVADAIEAEVLQPYREYQRKLAEYHDTLTETLAEEPTLSRETVIDLKDYQKHLNLKDEDVRSIEESLVGQALALETLAISEPKNSPKPTDPKSSKPKNSEQKAIKQYSTFSFETVKVNAQGKVIETIPGKAEYYVEDLGNGVTLEMVRIPGSTFRMGAAEGEERASEDEYPQHQVTVPEFWMGKYAVTQAQWQAITGLKKVDRELKPDPSNFKGAKRPVEQVRWEDAVEFCQRLSQKAGREYRLPSEAEWEYACRAGTTTPFYFGPTITADLANYDASKTYGQGPKGTYRKETIDVGSFPPNAFGLYDMHGNVWEWCLDHWHDSYEGAPSDGSAWLSSGDRLLRGGSWDYYPDNCRAANRNYNQFVYLYYDVGFRVVSCFPRTL